MPSTTEKTATSPESPSGQLGRCLIVDGVASSSSPVSLRALIPVLTITCQSPVQTRSWSPTVPFDVDLTPHMPASATWRSWRPAQLAPAWKLRLVRYVDVSTVQARSACDCFPLEACHMVCAKMVPAPATRWDCMENSRGFLEFLEGF